MWADNTITQDLLVNAPLEASFALPRMLKRHKYQPEAGSVPFQGAMKTDENHSLHGLCLIGKPDMLQSLRLQTDSSRWRFWGCFLFPLPGAVWMSSLWWSPIVASWIATPQLYFLGRFTQTNAWIGGFWICVMSSIPKIALIKKWLTFAASQKPWNHHSKLWVKGTCAGIPNVQGWKRLETHGFLQRVLQVMHKFHRISSHFWWLPSGYLT